MIYENCGEFIQIENKDTYKNFFKGFLKKNQGYEFGTYKRDC